MAGRPSLLWWLLVATQFTSLLPATAAWPLVRRTEKENPPVCIIGAGPAGLTAASRLQEKGIKAIVFDKQAEVGGKCQAWYDDQGIFHPLGAAFFSNASYPETVKVVDQSGVRIEPFALAGARAQFEFNYTTGDTEPVVGIAATVVQQLYREIPRYAQVWQTRFAPYSVANFKKGVPDEFTVSGTEWFRTNNFTALPEILVNPLALYGYGDVNLVPALYVLQYITPDLLTAFIGQRNVYYADFHAIWGNFTEKKLCSTEIRTNHEIRCIDRSGENPVVKYTYPHGNFYKWGHQTCSKLIMALPPLVANLERAGLDLTEEENNVFKDVVVHNYFSSAVELELPFGVSYIASSENATVPPPSDGQPVAVLHLSAESNVSVSWSWGPDYPPYYLSEAAAEETLIETFGRINKDPRNLTAQSEPFCRSDVKEFRKWDYFPHFNSQPLKDGAYKKLNELQGCSKTYWASGLGGMETVEWSIRAGQDVVDSYF